MFKYILLGLRADRVIKKLQQQTDLEEAQKTDGLQGIASALKTADDWASMVTIMNMDKKKYAIVTKDIALNQSDDPTVLRMPSCLACNKVSKEREEQDWRTIGIASTRLTPRKPQKIHSHLAAVPTGAEIAVSMGCFRCSEFGHTYRECQIDPDTLTCKGCSAKGHVQDVCPRNRPRSSSQSRNRLPRSISSQRPGSLSQDPRDSDTHNMTDRRATEQEKDPRGNNEDPSYRRTSRPKIRKITKQPLKLQSLPGWHMQKYWP